MRKQMTNDIRQYVGWVQIRKNAVRIYCEGDSWVDYFSCDVLTEVYDQALTTPVILKKSNGGDESSQIFSGKQRHELVKDFVTMVKRNARPDVILLSAGGNDLVGKYDFPLFIKKAAHGSPVEAFINKDFFALRLQQVALGYVEMGYLRDRFFPGIPIVTHQYDWITPSDEGVEILGMEVMNSWMKPYMDKLEIQAGVVSDQKKIADYVLGQFSNMLNTLKDGTFTIENQGIKINHFHIAGTQGTLNHDEWENEIHPTEDGFTKVGKVVLETIRDSSPNISGRI